MTNVTIKPMATDATIQVRTTSEFKQRLQVLAASRQMDMTSLMMYALTEQFPVLRQSLPGLAGQIAKRSSDEAFNKLLGHDNAN